MPKSLPANPNLEQYRKQAKDLLKAWKAGDAEARQRISKHHPRLSRVSETQLGQETVGLADVQVALAREHGFENWAAFVEEIERRTGVGARNERTWRDAERAVLAGDAPALDALLRDHRQLFETRQPPPYGPEPGRLAPHYSGRSAQEIIAANHEFDSWDDFLDWQRAANVPASPVASFEAAADAIGNGDLATLRRLLRDDPDLIRARSARKHHSTLLHYVGANGIEAFRQKTPKNALEILRFLLDAGAEVDAPAGMYGGGSTTLGLVATSIHPLLAGVQEELMGELLVRGAALEDPRAGGNDQSAIAGCLANGRPQAARYLADRGARLDLDGAAGVGMLNAVERFFDANGHLVAGATVEQMKRGFDWACQYGHADVVGYLLRRGVDPAGPREGASPLHWAGYGGNRAVVAALLQAGAPVNARDATYDGTPLGWALYGWAEQRGRSGSERYYDAVSELIRAGGTVAPEWLREEDRGYPIDEYLRDDERMAFAMKRVP